MAAARMKSDILDGLVSNRKSSLLQIDETLQTATGRSSGVSFEVQELTDLPFYSARRVAPDLSMQALKFVNNVDVWQIWFQALPQDCSIQPRRSNQWELESQLHDSRILVLQLYSEYQKTKIIFPYVLSCNTDTEDRILQLKVIQMRLDCILWSSCFIQWYLQGLICKLKLIWLDWMFLKILSDVK